MAARHICERSYGEIKIINRHNAQMMPNPGVKYIDWSECLRNIHSPRMDVSTNG